MSDDREYAEAVCWMCHGPASWLVYEDKHDRDSDWLLTCDAHRYAAFS